MFRTMGVIAVLMSLWCGRLWAAEAVAAIKGTSEGSAVNGEVTFKDTPLGLEVHAQVADVPPGKHGFHIHETGSCADMGKAAGPHYNPMNMPHGFLPKDGEQHAHMGDLGNIEIGTDGKGTLHAVLPGVSLTGEHNVVGRAVILHEKEDDFSQPAGNAGSRIGCGVIIVVDHVTSVTDSVFQLAQATTTNSELPDVTPPPALEKSPETVAAPPAELPTPAPAAPLAVEPIAVPSITNTEVPANETKTEQPAAVTETPKTETTVSVPAVDNPPPAVENPAPSAPSVTSSPKTDSLLDSFVAPLPSNPPAKPKHYSTEPPPDSLLRKTGVGE